MPIAIPATQETEARSVWRSIARGLRGRCPNCGEGRLIRGYLTPVATCPVCGEDLSHQRSDDFGPYLTMVIVGHLVVPALLAVMLATVISPVTILAVALPATAILALALLRPIKGAIIGLQWALKMHGFDGSADPDAPEAGLGFPPAAALRAQPLPKSGLTTK
jgi:uncharacterized protein (DUF983 family)